MTRNRRRHQSGFVLFAAMTALVGALLLINVSFSRSLVERLAAERYVSKHQAFHLAEAGIEDVFFELRRPEDDRFKGYYVPWETVDSSHAKYAECLDLGEPCQRYVHNLAIGTVDTLVGKVGTEEPTVRVTAQMNGVTQALELEAGLAVGPPNNFPWALMAGTDIGTGITLSALGSGKKVTIDNFDSRLGSYNTWTNATDPGNPSTYQAHIRANSSGTDPTRAIVLDTTSIVYGNAIAGPDAPASLTITGSPQLGPIQASTTVTMPPVILPPGNVGCPTCPHLDCGGGVSMTVDTFNANFAGIVSTTAGESEEAPCNITIVGDGVVQMDQVSVSGYYSGVILDGNITLVVHGDVLLYELTGLNLGSHTAYRTSGNLYVDGNVNFGGSSGYGVGVNVVSGIDQVTGGQVTHNPADFKVYVAGNHTVKVRQGSTINGVIYAPQSDIQIATASSGSNNNQWTYIYGSLIGRTVSIGKPTDWGDIYVHYDTSLNPGGDGVGVFMPGVSLKLWRYRRP